MKIYLKNSLWLFLDYALSFVGGIIISIYLLRYLGPDDYGVYGYGIAMLGIATPFSVLGIQGTLVRELVSSEHRQEEVLGTAFLLRLLGAIVSCLVFSTYLFLIVESDERLWFALALLLTIIFQPFTILLLYFESVLKGRDITIVRAISLLVKLACIAILIMIGCSLMYFVIPLVLEALLLAGMLVYRYSKTSVQSLMKWSWSNGVATSLLRKSWPLIISGLSAVLYLRLDQVMITEIKGEYEGGIYMAAVRMSSVFYMFPAIIVSTFFPKLVSLYGTDESSFSHSFRSIMQILLLSSFGIILIMQVFGSGLVELLLGVEYKSAIPVFLVHIYSLILVFVGVLLSRWLIIADLTIYSLSRHGLGLVANLGLNLLWIPRYGAIGAAYASLISLFCAVILFNVFSRKTRPFLKHLIYSFKPKYTASMILEIKERFQHRTQL